MKNGKKFSLKIILAYKYKIIIKTMEKIINKIKKGEYNHGIQGYLKDAELHNITTQDAKGIIIDFLECRQIEKEEEKDNKIKNFNN